MSVLWPERKETDAMCNSSLLFKNHKDKGLTWIPWIGEKYFSEPQKLLVLGESHYCYGSNSPQDIESCENETVEVVGEYANGSSAGNQYKTYGTIDEVLGRTFFPGAGRLEIWSRIAFMNIVQKCMANNQARPKWEFFLTGWKAVLYVIRALKPDACLCFSTGKMVNRVNFNRLEEFRPEFDFSYCIRPTQDTQMKISGCIVATPGGITIEDGKEIPVIFVQHPSRMKKIDEWCKVIEQYHPMHG